MSDPAAAASATAAAPAAAAPAPASSPVPASVSAVAAESAAKKARQSEEARCAHNETGFAVLKAALRAMASAGPASADSLLLVHFASKEKGEARFRMSDKPDSMSVFQAELEAQCDAIIRDPQHAFLEVVGSCANTKHAATALQAVSELRRLRIIKPKKYKEEGMYQLEFVVGDTAEALDKTREAEREKANSKKTKASQDASAAALAAAAGPSSAAAAVNAASEAASGAAAAIVSGAKAVAAGVAKAVSSASKAAHAASSSTSSSSSSDPVSHASSDYVSDTVQSVYGELALPAVAKLLLLQACEQAKESEAERLLGGMASPDPAATTVTESSTPKGLLEAAALLTKEQRAGLLSKAELATNPTPAQLLAIRGGAKIVHALTAEQLTSTLSGESLRTLQADLLRPLESYLVMFANQAYTRGFSAAVKAQKDRMPLEQLL